MDPRHVAVRLLGAIDWQTEVSGYCRCPGEAFHTSANGKKDCRVNVDGAPTIFCFHASCSPAVAEAIVEGADHAGLGEGFVVLDEEEIDHEPDDLARGEVFAGGLVGELGELADEFLEHGAHLGIADGVGVEVDGGKLFGDEVEEAGLGQAVDLGVEIEALKDVTHGGREGVHVGAQVFADVVLVAHELFRSRGEVL